MAGIYIHIPFCRKVCYYCDFHFVATLKYKDDMIKAMVEEIKLKSPYWKDTIFNTLYFGGGTPSLLSIEELNLLSEEIKVRYNFSSEIEHTLEANPDDLTVEYLTSLKNKTEINRLSIGTQSFHDKDLTLMNRRHNGQEAYDSIKIAREVGFDNLNIDLIYGVPGLTNDQWKENIEKFLELRAPHLSAYHLTFEPKTVFDHMRKKNKISPVNEDTSQQHYEILVNKLKQNGFEHYEVSNFAKNGFYSEHNTNYWLGKKYLGIGPSAHSFYGDRRSWNIANNTKYCEGLLKNSNEYYTVENLSVTTRYNEYILTSLRTQWGINYAIIKSEYGIEYMDHIQLILQEFNENEHYRITKEGCALTEKGWFISDFIISKLFKED